MARLLAGGPWRAEDLVGIVGAGWQADGVQADALAAFLRLAIPPAHHLGLGDAWEYAVSCLAGCDGPLVPNRAEKLVAAWQRLAALRADGWRRPRCQRPRNGRRSEVPMSNLAELSA